MQLRVPSVLELSFVDKRRWLRKLRALWPSRRSWPCGLSLNCRLVVTFAMRERRPTSTMSSLKTVEASRCSQAACRLLQPVSRSSPALGRRMLLENVREKTSLVSLA